MEIIKLPPLGSFGVNAYIIISEKKNGVLIDAPDDRGYILKELHRRGINLKKILLTHGHCDHIASCGDIVRETGAGVFIHEGDIKKLSNQNTNLSRYFSLPPVDTVNGTPIADGQIITQDELDFEVLHTPGHTSGSVCYILGDKMFCGDTLFKNSMGRTDMPDGDDDKMADTLAMLYEFDVKTDYELLPGHGECSKMSTERMNNPYMRYAYKKTGNKL